jgi:hypothetical protein
VISPPYDRDDVDGAAAALVREVFQPLLEEVGEVMESEGVLYDGRYQAHDSTPPSGLARRSKLN